MISPDVRKTQITPHLPSFRALIALEAVVRHGNIVKAADELGVTSGAVSKQLSALEGALGARLFETGHRLVPLPAALTLSRSVGYAVSIVRDSWNEVAQNAAGRTMFIAANASFCMQWLAPRLLQAQKIVGGRPVQMSWLSSSDSWIRNNVDFAFLRGRVPPGDWICEDVGGETVTFFGNPEWCSRAREMGPQRLAQARFIKATTRPFVLERLLTAAGVDSTVDAQETTQFYIAIEAALAGDGLLAAPIALCRELVMLGRLAIPFPEITVAGERIIFASNPSTCSPAVQRRMSQWVQEEFRASDRLCTD
ncbi:LysR family transcriptional regulator [Shinella granuli]|uniref:DNA-binding transcriptional LysR family regulator n=1 Tax=Shinella granuli TaxID=323621 RepID=A0A4R2C613_SHIGR|nr:LysR family transcriptional regulator [Shinella granuli]TCN35631.1 DNA-binding transcriptional LysR family regulator [Shinella granuli]